MISRLIILKEIIQHKKLQVYGYHIKQGHQKLVKHTFSIRGRLASTGKDHQALCVHMGGSRSKQLGIFVFEAAGGQADTEQVYLILKLFLLMLFLADKSVLSTFIRGNIVF